MSKQTIVSEQFVMLKQLFRWTLIITPVAVATGSMVAFFLWSLHQAIEFRFQHPALLYLLPVAGILIHFIYRSIGKSSERGNNLIIDEIHKPGGGVPKRMTPIVLFATLITHLFGGSAGREGTAVQMGGSIAQMFANWFKLNISDTGIVLTAGVAAGFGAVFGTPLTGAVFAMEVLVIGRIKYDALLPCLIASTIGDITVGAWSVHHTAYHIDSFVTEPHFYSEWFSLDLWLLTKIAGASILFGITSYLFSELVRWVKILFTHFVKPAWLIPLFGGLIIIGLTFINGKPDYLSLGVDPEYAGAVTIPSAFRTGGADTWSWLWKTIYTTVTLGSGFKGGEVTPLFYIGATLGNTLSGILNAPVSLFAALGFIAVFAGATNTPLACTIMGVELFGGQHILFFAVACFTAYFFSGHSGVYSAQGIATPKTFDASFSNETSLSQASQRRNTYLQQKLDKYRASFNSGKTKNQ